MKGVILWLAIGLLSVCSAASFYPNSLVTQSGSASSQALSVLAVKEQSADQDTWASYVEFNGQSTVYRGVFSFPVTTATASSFALNVNFKGPRKSDQTWRFEWYVPSTNTYVFAGDNAAAVDWRWSLLSFTGSVSFSSLVSPSNTVQVRFSSATAYDACDLDFLELNVNSGSSTPSATAAPTNKPTASPTAKPSAKPTSGPTVPATVKPTSGPTVPATTKPSSGPTLSPTVKPTSSPTTQSPTVKATTAPTPGPTGAPGGKKCPTGTHYRPGPYTTWQWQLTGTVDTSFNVQIYDIDMFEASTTLINNLHAQGRAVVCYIDTAYEPGRPDSSQFTPAVLGNGIDGWPGQKWVDIRSSTVRTIMANRIAQAAAKNCDAVEMDDVDAYDNNPGFPLTAADQINFNNFLASTAHANGLGIALKNAIDLIPTLAPNFDFAVNEQCYQYSECGAYANFINQGKAVLGVEYNRATSTFCTQANTARYSWLKKGLDLGATPREQCCTTNCGGTHSCVPN